MILSDSFNKLLNRHGYGFQYTVLKVAQELHQRGDSKWVFEASEFPVRVQEQDTRIDFVLRLGKTWYMIAECKRADPKFSNWCFVRAPMVRRNQAVDGFIFDCAQVDGRTCGVSGQEINAIEGKMAYHIGLPVKSRNDKGESRESRHAIEQAAGQVCRGLNGMIELFLRRPTDFLVSPVAFVPVIFTTAKIWTSETDLASGDLENGSVQLPKGDLREREWVYYQYHISPGLKHSGVSLQRSSRLSDLLGYEYIRTIPVVSAKGIRSFLGSFDPISW